MNEQQIKKTWKQIKTQMTIGLVVFIFSLLYFQFGSKLSLPQTLSLFGCVFGIIFMLLPGLKAIKFAKYLKERRK